MMRTIESSYNMNDILELIVDKVSTENQNIYQELKFFIDKPKLMTFFVVNNDLQEIIRYYDPLYANAYVRNSNPNAEITISVKLESNEDISRNDRDVIFKKSNKFLLMCSASIWSQVGMSCSTPLGAFSFRAASSLSLALPV